MSNDSLHPLTCNPDTEAGCFHCFRSKLRHR